MLGQTDPFAAFRALQDHFGDRDVYVMESLAGPSVDTSAAIVGFHALFSLEVHKGQVTLSGVEPLLSHVRAAIADSGLVDENFQLTALSNLWQLNRVVHQLLAVDNPTPGTFNFGFFAVYAYDSIFYIDEIERQIDDRAHPPADVTLTLFQGAAVCDLQAGTTRVVVGSSQAAEPQFADLDIDEVAALITGATEIGATDAATLPAPTAAEITDTVTQAEFEAVVERCLGHIAIGDVYQVVPGHEIRMRSQISPQDVYQRLRIRNPSPYMAFAPVGAELTLISASPEMLVRNIEGHVVMRPIAGTAPRSGDTETDRAAVAELLASEKEVAEHVMLVDLCRNDLGKFAAVDTVSVDQLMIVEEYSHVFHMVSTVSATVEDHFDTFDIIPATFPAGTMTGTPKVRALEVIEDVETTRRGIYAGAFGLIDCTDYVNLGLAIRTVINREDEFVIRAGAGVVADSTPQAEWRETLAKMSAGYWAVTGESLI